MVRDFATACRRAFPRRPSGNRTVRSSCRRCCRASAPARRAAIEDRRGAAASRRRQGARSARRRLPDVGFDRRDVARVFGFVPGPRPPPRRAAADAPEPRGCARSSWRLAGDSSCCETQASCVAMETLFDRSKPPPPARHLRGRSARRPREARRRQAPVRRSSCSRRDRRICRRSAASPPTR